MARLNMRHLVDFLIGRLAKWEEVKISLAILGSEVITAGVEPKLKAMSSVAAWLEPMQAKVRWGRPWLKLNKLPKSGRPRGPGIETRPIWFLPFFHAMPPLEKAQVKRIKDRNDASMARKKKPLSKFSVPKCAMASIENIHQLIGSIGVGIDFIFREWRNWVARALGGGQRRGESLV